MGTCYHWLSDSLFSTYSRSSTASLNFNLTQISKTKLFFGYFLNFLFFRRWRVSTPSWHFAYFMTSWSLELRVWYFRVWVFSFYLLWFLFSRLIFWLLLCFFFLKNIRKKRRVNFMFIVWVSILLVKSCHHIKQRWLFCKYTLAVLWCSLYHQ